MALPFNFFLNTFIAPQESTFSEFRKIGIVRQTQFTIMGHRYTLVRRTRTRRSFSTTVGIMVRHHPHFLLHGSGRCCRRCHFRCRSGRRQIGAAAAAVVGNEECFVDVLAVGGRHAAASAERCRCRGAVGRGGIEGKSSGRVLTFNFLLYGVDTRRTSFRR